jgi:hypothetical protein
MPAESQPSLRLRYGSGSLVLVAGETVCDAFFSLDGSEPRYLYFLSIRSRSPSSFFLSPLARLSSFFLSFCSRFSILFPDSPLSSTPLAASTSCIHSLHPLAASTRLHPTPTPTPSLSSALLRRPPIFPFLVPTLFPSLLIFFRLPLPAPRPALSLPSAALSVALDALLLDWSDAAETGEGLEGRMHSPSRRRFVLLSYILFTFWLFCFLFRAPFPAGLLTPLPAPPHASFLAAPDENLFSPSPLSPHFSRSLSLSLSLSLALYAARRSTRLSFSNESRFRRRGIFINPRSSRRQP